MRLAPTFASRCVSTTNSCRPALLSSALICLSPPPGARETEACAHLAASRCTPAPHSLCAGRLLPGQRQLGHCCRRWCQALLLPRKRTASVGEVETRMTRACGWRATGRLLPRFAVRARRCDVPCLSPHDPLSAGSSRFGVPLPGRLLRVREAAWSCGQCPAGSCLRGPPGARTGAVVLPRMHRIPHSRRRASCDHTRAAHS